jgi:hypothetical protein
LTSALDEYEWSASHHSRFTPEERVPVTHWIEGLVSLRTDLDAVAKRIVLRCRESNPGRPAPIPSLYLLNYQVARGSERSICNVATVALLRIQICSSQNISGRDITHQAAKCSESFISWDITPCSPLRLKPCFEGIYRLRLYGKRVSPIRNQHEAGSKESSYIYQVFLGLLIVKYTRIYINKLINELHRPEPFFRS